MFKELLKNPKALMWALVFHVLIIVLLLLSFKFTDRPSVDTNVPVQMVAPEGLPLPEEKVTPPEQAATPPATPPETAGGRVCLRA